MLMVLRDIFKLISGSAMPCAPRQNKKATKIAWKITGKPANLENKRSSMQEKVDKALLYQETTRVR